jgi:hypothetical protein
MGEGEEVKREHTPVRLTQWTSWLGTHGSARCLLTVAFRCALPRVALLPLFVEELLLLLDA